MWSLNRTQTRVQFFVMFSSKKKLLSKNMPSYEQMKHNMIQKPDIYLLFKLFLWGYFYLSHFLTVSNQMCQFLFYSVMHIDFFNIHILIISCL